MHWKVSPIGTTTRRLYLSIIFKNKVSLFIAIIFFISCCLLLEPRRRQRAQPTEQAVEPQQEPQQLDEGKSFYCNHFFISCCLLLEPRRRRQRAQNQHIHHLQ